MSDEIEVYDMPVAETAAPAEVVAEEVAADEGTLAQPVGEVTTEVDPDDEPARKKTGSQRHKEKALFYREEAERYRSEAAMLREQLEGKAAPVKAAAPGRPEQSDFATDADWIEALTEWKTEAKIADIKQREVADLTAKSWDAKAKEARQEYADYDSALEDAPAPSRVVAEALMDNPLGAKVAYYLATHPEDYARVNKMSVNAAVREITLIESKLAPTKPETKKLTQAPKPPTPVSSASMPSKDISGRMETY